MKLFRISRRIYKHISSKVVSIKIKILILFLYKIFPTYLQVMSPGPTLYCLENATIRRKEKQQLSHMEMKKGRKRKRKKTTKNY